MADEIELHEVGRKWIARLEAKGFNPTEISRAIRIQTVAATDGNVDAVRAAKAVLVRTCGDAETADLAWQTLVEASHSLVARKGRWDLLAIVQLLTAANVSLGHADTPGGLIVRAVGWARETNQTFTVFGAGHPVPLDAAWIALRARLIDPTETLADPEAAMARYRGLEPPRSRGEREETYDAEFLGWFKRRGVVIAGPGLGKSTLLRRQAQRYATDGYPVLKVQLRKVAASLATGETFEATIIRQGLDGSRIDPSRIANIGADGWVLLADGLDECGSAQEDVADGLHRLSIGHPACRIIVTTRPIGYETKALTSWAHYALIRPDSSAATAHVSRLIEAIAPDGSPLKSTGYSAASAAFRRSKPASAIASDPQLLGMAASLIVRDEPLGRSRIELFQRLFSSVERNAAMKAADGEIDLDLCHAVLDRIGWWVTAEPLGSFDSILAHVSSDLAVLLATTPLAASKQVRDAARFWEKIGVIERIHHRQTPLLAFVHKSFGEHAAARHLVGMAPAVRTRELERIAGSPQWAEVLTFAAGLGLGSEVLDVLLSANELIRAVEIAADPAVNLSGDAADHLAETAFAAVDDGKERIKIGSALSMLAARHPASVGPRAAKRIDDPNEEIRRIAWGCVVEAGPEHHDPDEAARQAIEMLQREGPGVRSSLMGGIRLMRSDRFDITRRMALTNLKLLITRWTSTELETHVEQLIGGGNATTVDFLQGITDIVRPLGIEPHWPKQRLGSTLDLIRHDSEYGEAETRAVEALLDAIADAVGMDPEDFPAEPLDVTVHPLLQLSGLIRIIGYWETSGSEVWAWTETYEREPVAELLRIVIALSDLDAARLAREVATIRRKLAEEPRPKFFWALEDVPHVHIDDPRWERLSEASPDLGLVERALAHESEWVVQVATAILAHAGTGPEHVARMLATTSGLGFASAGYLAVQLPEPTGSSLILDRLEGTTAIGMRHLFRMLGSTGVAWTGRVAGVAEKHLLGSSEWTAYAAADFVLAQMAAGADVDPELLWRAYRHWQQHEPRQDSGGAIPQSPRDALFKALLARDQVSDDVLIEASSDCRYDVRKPATEKLLARAAQDSSVVRLIGAGIDTGAVGPHLARQLLAADVPLDQDTVDAITRRLEDSNPRWRLAAAAILQTRYLPQDRIGYFIKKLGTDDHAEIREAAARTVVDDAT